ncbi:MAG: glycosyltransferase family 4 protein [Nitrospiraceae bacterium]|nr:MAG: glycosyltransferase family 4 protein [Nitrospiraceae bacterium]
MKILFIYLFLSLGGVETVLKNRQEGFRALGIQTDYIFLEDHGGSASFQKLEGSRVHITNKTNEIEKIIAEGNYSLISVIDTPQVHDTLRKIAKSINVVMEVHTPYPPFRKYIREDIIEDAKAIVVPTATFGSLVESEMKRPHPAIVVIPNPVNSDFLNKKKDLPVHSRVPVEMVSRIESIKYWREGVRIMEGVLQKRRDIDFFLVGKPVEDKPIDIYREFSKRRIMGHLRWLPFIQYSRMPSFYQFIAHNKGVYLTSSKGESFGMTLIESMASHVPIVAYSLPVFREVLGNGEFGKIYRSVEDAAEYILSLIENRNEREDQVACAYQSVLERYTPKAFAEMWRKHILQE